jgi:hypothetical protein
LNRLKEKALSIINLIAWLACQDGFCAFRCQKGSPGMSKTLQNSDLDDNLCLKTES